MNGQTAHMPGLLEQHLLGGNSQWHNQYRELEAPVPIVLQAVHRGLSGQSVSLEEREFDIRLWGFRATPALLM